MISVALGLPCCLYYVLVSILILFLPPLRHNIRMGARCVGFMKSADRTGKIADLKSSGCSTLKSANRQQFTNVQCTLQNEYSKQLNSFFFLTHRAFTVLNPPRQTKWLFIYLIQSYIFLQIYTSIIIVSFWHNINWTAKIGFYLCVLLNVLPINRRLNILYYVHWFSLLSLCLSSPLLFLSE
jgi:hypothetical protein